MEMKKLEKLRRELNDDMMFNASLPTYVVAESVARMKPEKIRDFIWLIDRCAASEEASDAIVEAAKAIELELEAERNL